MSDSDSVRIGEQPASVRIPVVGLVKVSIGETSDVNLDGVLTPRAATLDLWRGYEYSVLVDLGPAEGGVGTLSLRGDSTATSLNFRAVLDVLQLRSAAASSEDYRRILVRPDISGSAFRKDFHVREVEVSAKDANEAPKKPADPLPEQPVDEDATVTYQVLAFTDKEDDAAGTDLTYEAKLVVSGSERGLPTDGWIAFDGPTRTFTFKPLAIHVGRPRFGCGGRTLEVCRIMRTLMWWSLR